MLPSLVDEQSPKPETREREKREMRISSSIPFFLRHLLVPCRLNALGFDSPAAEPVEQLAAAAAGLVVAVVDMLDSVGIEIGID